MKIGVAQIGSIKGRPDLNVTTIIAAMADASKQQCRLLITPECALSGYMFETREEIEAVAISVESATVADLAAACSELKMHIVVGLLEADGDKIYNSALTIGPKGILGVHRKRHLPLLGADRFVDQPQDSVPPVYDTEIGKVGVAICYEIRFPEVIRTLALAGADIVALPTAWPTEARMLPEIFTRVRAAENFVYFLAANRNDVEGSAEFMGESQIVAPSGQLLINGGVTTGVYCADFDADLARRKSIIRDPGVYEVHPFKDRRPQTYIL
ncbi:carbon-nitrogen hydrolase family protein [Mesorhizobium sp. SB112]|uniref:carbon-nitrogen hydrolase family protein n=1 Tax=Mesorhizobium sp. SB112 TaxID=3151853 RepID=UPI003263F818